MPLTLHDANQVIARAHAKATEIGIRVTVAIVDEGGLLIALARMDGATPLSPQIAEAKAVGAAMLHRDGAGLAEMTNAGLPVPPGFTVSTEVCNIYYREKGKIPPQIEREIDGRWTTRYLARREPANRGAGL